MNGPPAIKGAAYRAAAEICTRRLWALDRGPASDGLQHGMPSLIPAQTIAKQLKKEARYEELRILYNVVTGAYWKMPRCALTASARKHPSTNTTGAATSIGMKILTNISSKPGEHGRNRVPTACTTEG